MTASLRLGRIAGIPIGASWSVLLIALLVGWPLAGTILPGITRDSVLTLARDAGYTVVEQQIAREMLYLADEVFFTGTAEEITPVRSVDRIAVGTGRRGPITERLQRDFFALLSGEAEDRYGWLTPVPVQVAVDG